jgi:hypothetical protein
VLCFPTRCFDENSTWWSSENKILPDTASLKEKLEESSVGLKLAEIEELDQPDKQPNEQTDQQENNPSQNQTPGLRISNRECKQNPRYANTTAG